MRLGGVSCRELPRSAICRTATVRYFRLPHRRVDGRDKHRAHVSQFLSLSIVWLSEGYLLSGRLEEAREHAERAVELARKHKERGHEAWALKLLGDIALHRDPPDIEHAEARYGQAFALSDELGMRPLQAHCHVGLGNIYVAMGSTEQARAELSSAIELFRSMDMTSWLPRVETALRNIST